MKSPLFLDDNQDPLNFPGLIYYNLDKTIHIPEKILPYVKCSLVVNSNTSEEMYGVKCIDIIKWKDYTCVYGDSTLLYQGVLNFSYPIEPGLLYQGMHHENNGEGYSWSEPLHISPSLDWRWRYKYYRSDPWGFDNVFFDSTFHLFMEFAQGTSSHMIAPSSENLFLPSASYRANIHNESPHPPDYIADPLYRSIRLTKNIPDAEAYKSALSFQPYCNRNILKIGDNNYKINVNGKLYYNGKSKPTKLEFQRIDFSWVAVLKNLVSWDENDIWWTWWQWYEWEFLGDDGSYLNKTQYGFTDESVDLKLMVSVNAPFESRKKSIK
jgi:hypothetical protein